MSPMRPPYPEPNPDATLTQLRMTLRVAQDKVFARVRLMCPGEHRVTQHRDARPPWCNECGRDNEGNLHGKPKEQTND